MLDKRIAKAINDLKVIGVATNQDPIPGYKTNDDFAAEVKAAYQSLQALITRRAAIKAAIVLSNATTELFVADTKMIVAEAIERKGLIGNDENLLNKMVRDQMQAIQRVERETEALKPRLDSYITGALGKDTKGKEDQVKNVTEQFMELHKPRLIDPLSGGISKVIKELSDEINTFKLEVDFALDASNIKTMIRIPKN
jgi:hypothetical protein